MLQCYTNSHNFWFPPIALHFCIFYVPLFFLVFPFLLCLTNWSSNIKILFPQEASWQRQWEWDIPLFFVNIVHSCCLCIDSSLCLDISPTPFSHDKLQFVFHLLAQVSFPLWSNTWLFTDSSVPQYTPVVPLITFHTYWDHLVSLFSHY